LLFHPLCCVIWHSYLPFPQERLVLHFFSPVWKLPSLSLLSSLGAPVKVAGRAQPSCHAQAKPTIKAMQTWSQAGNPHRRPKPPSPPRPAGLGLATTLGRATAPPRAASRRSAGHGLTATWLPSRYGGARRRDGTVAAPWRHRDGTATAPRRRRRDPRRSLDSRARSLECVERSQQPGSWARWSGTGGGPGPQDDRGSRLG
jgi:hypothetical protein